MEFLTYFDSHYSACGLALLDSLLKNSPGAQITVLCLDDITTQILASELGSRIRLLSLDQLAHFEPALRPLTSKRSPWEFYATQKPIFIDWALQNARDSSPIVFTDADTFYFSDPAPIFSESIHASIVLSPHRFHHSTRHLQVYGTFNAGFGVWKHDSTARKSIKDWSRDCLKWCEVKVQSDGRFMNQGYLNAWPKRYPNLHILQHPGANLGPWNVASHRLESSPTGPSVDSLPLIFYHFSSLSKNCDGSWQTYDQGPAMHQEVLHQSIYRPYLQTLESISQRLNQRFGITGIGSLKNGLPSKAPMISFR